MRLELAHVALSPDGARVTAQVVATDYGYSVDTSCHAELLNQWPSALVRAYLVKEAAAPARAKLAAAIAKAEADENAEQLAQLAAFEDEFTPELNNRIDAFFTAALAHYATEPERLAAVQAEYAAWQASQVDVSQLAGEL